MTQIYPQPAMSEPGPRIMLMVTESLVDTTPNTKGPSMFWRVGAPHPFNPDMIVMAIFVVEGVVEIYSANTDSKLGMRDLVPVHCARLIQEAMPSFKVFVEELAHAEAGDDDDDDDEDFNDADPDDEGAPLQFDPAPAPSNGQVEP